MEKVKKTIYKIKQKHQQRDRKSIKEPKEILEVKTIIMEMKNSLEVFKGRFEWTKK